MLDARVEDVLHVVATRVGQDRAVAERAWPELDPPLEPADDAAVGEHVGRALDDLVGVEFLEREPRALDRGPQPLRGVLRAPVRVIHAERARGAELRVVHVIRRAHARAAVVGGRLDVEIGERGLVEDLPVHDAVEGDAAGQTQRAEPRLRVQVAQHAQHDLLEPGLERGRDVAVAVLQRLVGAAAGGSEQGLHARPPERRQLGRAAVPRHRRTLDVVAEVVEPEVVAEAASCARCARN